MDRDVATGKAVVQKREAEGMRCRVMVMGRTRR